MARTHVIGDIHGNHDALLLSAARFGGAFQARWKENGRAERDLTGLTERHIAWLSQLPAMARVDDALLVHADAPFYARHGHSIAAVNAAIAAILVSDDTAAWERLLDDFGEHDYFFDSPPDGIARFLDMYGGRRLIHGHTPIGKATGRPDAIATSALVYAGGRCVNVDGGIYRGGPGFVFALDDVTPEP